MEAENVREKLNTLLHKKISDQQERELKVKIEDLVDNNTIIGTPDLHSIVHIKQELQDIDPDYPLENSQSILEDSVIQNFKVKDQFKHISLHAILNEKKKALLQNKEVMEFLNSKIKY